ncbi:hypothetical protein DDB_G0293104 [Dictyostelium discoideum AX4]|nr:hypothetical protein DDB_G0293104 [Dictyostelium discoideum AX4]EAL60904.1 hypothetical protein DDB_G0293104 [Dictyostelium discoideum AX4]|eukprot:XP_629331.1 hypothetical protein DDB_G0293104 [Dictyostelium discoideum AX4]
MSEKKETAMVMMMRKNNIMVETIENYCVWSGYWFYFCVD